MKTLRACVMMGVATLALSASTVQAAGAAGPEEEARALELQARQMSESRQEYGAAAKLFRRAARLYGDSPSAAKAFHMAGKLAYYDGDNRAVNDMKRAGEIAVAFGYVGLAAQAYLDGAWLAQREGMGQVALDLATRAERLTASPLLAETERAALKRRLGHRSSEVVETASRVVP